MSTIRCIYFDDAPRFPATDQHPDAVRYTVRSDSLGRDVVVDAIGGKPTAAEVDAVLNPTVRVRTVAEKLAAVGLTAAELKAELAK